MTDAGAKFSDWSEPTFCGILIVTGAEAELEPVAELLLLDAALVDVAELVVELLRAVVEVDVLFALAVFDEEEEELTDEVAPLEAVVGVLVSLLATELGTKR